MAFEPLGYGSRWYDRLHVGVMRPKHFAVLLLVVITLIAVWEVS